MEPNQKNTFSKFGDRIIKKIFFLEYGPNKKNKF